MRCRAGLLRMRSLTRMRRWLRLAPPARRQPSALPVPDEATLLRRIFQDPDDLDGPAPGSSAIPPPVPSAPWPPASPDRTHP
jgi:hypothetical protein